jgi:LysM repeat protein
MNDYQIKTGDNLSTIAQTYNTTVDNLLALNPEIGNADEIIAGQSLKLPRGVNAPADPPKRQVGTYTIQSGDNLSRLARQYKTTVAGLLRLNPSIEDADRIGVGQSLNVPASQKPSGIKKLFDQPSGKKKNKGPKVKIPTDITSYLLDNEGFESIAYADPDPKNGWNVPTIGYGSTRTPQAEAYFRRMGVNPDTVFVKGSTHKITETQGRDLVNLVVQDNLQLLKQTPHFKYTELPRGTQIVLQDMAYNMGVGTYKKSGLLKFEKMIAALNKGDFNTAALEVMDSDYGRGVTRNRALRNAAIVRRGL